MNFKLTMCRICTALLTFTLSSTAFATGGTITFTSPSAATSIPTLSGTMLIILSLLLFVVAARITNQKRPNGGRFFIALLGVTALAFGGGGVKLISDSYAGTTSSFPIDETTPTDTLIGNSSRLYENVTLGPLNVSLEAGVGSKCLLICDDNPLVGYNGGSLTPTEESSSTVNAEGFCTATCGDEEFFEDMFEPA